MLIRFDKIDRFIKIHGKSTYSVLFDYSYCDKICDKIKYLIIEKSGIAGSINHNFARIRIDSYNSLSNEKILTVHNVIVLIKSGLLSIKITTTIIYFYKKVHESNTEYFQMNACIS